MRFSIESLLQFVRRMLEPGPIDGSELPPVHPSEVEEATEDRLTVTEDERSAAQRAAHEAMERIRRERGERSGGN